MIILFPTITGNARWPTLTRSNTSVGGQSSVDLRLYTSGDESWSSRWAWAAETGGGSRETGESRSSGHVYVFARLRYRMMLVDITHCSRIVTPRLRRWTAGMMLLELKWIQYSSHNKKYLFLMWLHYNIINYCSGIKEGKSSRLPSCSRSC